MGIGFPQMLQKCDYGTTTYIYSIEISGSLESRIAIAPM